MLSLVTTSGNVILLAISNGTPNSFILIVGSDVITVRALKLTRFVYTPSFEEFINLKLKVKGLDYILD